MLRRAENVYLTHSPGLLTGKGWVLICIGSRMYRIAKASREDVAQSEAMSMTFPVRCARIGDRTYYKFQGKFYWDNDDLSPHEVYALLVTRQQREAARIDRAQAIVAMGLQPHRAARGVIPDDVKQLVFTRDGGRCRNCGSNVELQFDHIIPVALGGNSEPENLQLLCGTCNRRKGSGLTMG